MGPTAGPDHMDLDHGSQIGRDCRLLDWCWCGGIDLGRVGLNTPGPIPYATMTSVYVVDMDLEKNLDPDAVGIEIDYLAPDTPLGDSSG